MPIPEVMRWIPSQRRWRRMYKGKQYYVSARQLGCPETKKGSILQANLWWKETQAKIDSANRPVPRQPLPMEDLLAALIGGKPWTNQEDIGKSVAGYLERLPPSAEAETLADHAEYAAYLESERGDVDAWDALASTLGRWLLPKLLERTIIDGEPLPDVLKEHLPSARVNQLETAVKGIRGEQTTEPGRTIRAHVDSWYERQSALELAGTLKARTIARTKQFIDRLAEFAGETADVGTINAETLEGFYRHCLGKVAERRKDSRAGWSIATATKTFSAVRSWIRWLAESGIVPLPANIASRSFRFGSALKRVETWSVDEVRRVIGAATGRLKLAMLLMLNCGFVQVDASELRDDEVDWSEGRIIRRRSKTADKKSAPVVNYKLWPLTFELLQKYRSGQEQVILTKSGKPFIRHEIKDGKLSNSDSFDGTYKYLRKKLGFTKPLKQLRKTGASMLAEHPTYGRFAQLYLGHAPSTMADRHYVAPPQALFDEAIAWLGKQFGFVD